MIYHEGNEHKTGFIGCIAKSQSIICSERQQKKRRRGRRRKNKGAMRETRSAKQVARGNKARPKQAQSFFLFLSGAKTAADQHDEKRNAFKVQTPKARRKRGQGSKAACISLQGVDSAPSRAPAQQLMAGPVNIHHPPVSSGEGVTQ
jgi:hypothetical protein